MSDSTLVPPADHDGFGSMAKPPFVTRLQVQNYKSIKGCDLELGPLTVLVGPNGSGKSNIVDTLRFTADGLSTTLDNAIRDRGGINEVRRRSAGHPTHFAIRIEYAFPDGVSGFYGFKIGAQPSGGFQVTDEHCLVRTNEFGASDHAFKVKNGELVSTTLEGRLPAIAIDRLFLVSISSEPAFRRVWEALTRMGFYNLSPTALRGLQKPDPGLLLRADGSNLASVLGHLRHERSNVVERVTDYLRRLSPGVTRVERVAVGPMETVEFRQRVEGRANPWKFQAASMSDGTLRGLGVLVALLQTNSLPPTLVAIEEPEIALHPAAVGILIDAIREASQGTQVMVTSHSPDLLDRDDIDDSVIVAVVAHDGVTTVGPVNEAVRGSLREGLFTPGELLRLNELTPAPDSSAVQPRLFKSTVRLASNA